MPYPAYHFCAIALMLGLLLYSSVLPAAGSDREQQLAERLSVAVGAGEPVRLRADGEFLGLYHAALGRLPRRAVVVVHNMGGHPDWPEVVAPLRTGLPAGGWSTLSLQMPLLTAQAPADDYGATLDRAARRIDAGVMFLRQKGYSHVVVLGYGFGASQALAYMADKNDADGLVMLGILAREYLKPAVDIPALLAGVEAPILDIYGGRDFPEVVERADRRRQAARESAAEYSRRVVEGADHYFTDRQSRLLELLQEWLQTTFIESEVKTVE